MADEEQAPKLAEEAPAEEAPAAEEPAAEEPAAEAEAAPADADAAPADAEAAPAEDGAAPAEDAAAEGVPEGEAADTLPPLEQSAPPMKPKRSGSMRQASFKIANPEKPEALAASEELAGGNKPRASGDFYFSGSGSRVSRANFSSASLNQGAYAPTAMASRSSRQLAPGMSSRSLGMVKGEKDINLKQPSALGDMGNFNSPLAMRSFKDFTPMLGFRLQPPYAPVNDSYWTVTRPQETFTAAPTTFVPPPHAHHLADRTHSFHQQVVIGEENGRLVKRIGEITTRGHKTRDSVSPLKFWMQQLPVTCPAYVAPATTSRRKKAEHDTLENLRLHQRLATMKPTASLARSTTEAPFQDHVKYIQTRKKTSFNFM